MYFKTTSYSLVGPDGFHLKARLNVLVAGSYLLTLPAQFVRVALPEDIIVVRFVIGSTVNVKPAIPATPEPEPAPHCKPPVPGLGMAKVVAPTVTKKTSWLPAKDPFKVLGDSTPQEAVYLVTSPDTTW